MRTIHKEIKLFRFSELSEKAQQNAIEECIESQEWFGGDECRESLIEFCRHVGITLRDWSLGDRSSVRWEFDSVYRYDWDQLGQDGSHMRGVRLWKWLNNGHFAFTAEEIIEGSKGSCPLTLVWSDCAFFDAFARFLVKPDKHTTLDDLLDECKADFESACNQDYEYCFSEECARKYLENCDDEFTENGERY